MIPSKCEIRSCAYSALTHRRLSISCSIKACRSSTFPRVSSCISCCFFSCSCGCAVSLYASCQFRASAFASAVASGPFPQCLYPCLIQVSAQMPSEKGLYWLSKIYLSIPLTLFFKVFHLTLFFKVLPLLNIMFSVYCLPSPLECKLHENKDAVFVHHYMLSAWNIVGAQWIN